MNIASFSTVFPFLEIGSIGKSVIGKDIPYLRIGHGKKQVFYSASIHANEWITTPVLMKFIERLALSYVNDRISLRLFGKKYFGIYFYLSCSND